jgi:hypothetical protein
MRSRLPAPRHRHGHMDAALHAAACIPRRTRPCATQHCAPLLAPASLDESPEALAQRQAAQADFVGHADACTDSGRHGLGMAWRARGSPEVITWAMAEVPQMRYFLEFPSGAAGEAPRQRAVDINVLESVAAVCAVIAIVQHLGLCSGMSRSADPAHAPPLNADVSGTALPSTSATPDARSTPAHTQPPHPALPPYCRLIHIHVWTDSTSCLSWMTPHRAHYPIIAFLLQVLAHVQTLSGTVVTVGHIPGESETTSRTHPVAGSTARVAPESAP